jgi:hypothetical protein
MPDPRCHNHHVFGDLKGVELCRITIDQWHNREIKPSLSQSLAQHIA